MCNQCNCEIKKELKELRGSFENLEDVKLVLLEEEVKEVRTHLIALKSKVESQAGRRGGILYGKTATENTNKCEHPRCCVSINYTTREKEWSMPIAWSNVFISHYPDCGEKLPV